MKTRLSILLLISLFLPGCGATAVPTATLTQSTAKVLSPQEPTSTVSIVTLTLDTATIMVTEPSATAESTMTPQATATIPQVQMTVLTDESQPPPGVCQYPQNWVAYTVQVSDTLSSLMQRTGTSWQQIQAANCLTDMVIVAGQKLYLPFFPPPDPGNTPFISQTPPPPGPGDPKVSVSPGSGQPGDTFTIVMDDFPRNQKIQLVITFADTGVPVLSVPLTPNAEGDATYLYESPQNAQLGKHNIYARSVSDDATVLKTGEFLITSPYP